MRLIDAASHSRGRQPAAQQPSLDTQSHLSRQV
jgi:hypothetical protein